MRKQVSSFSGRYVLVAMLGASLFALVIVVVDDRDIGGTGSTTADPTPEPHAERNLAELGETTKFDAGIEATVDKIEQYAELDGWRPDAGLKFVTVNVHVCTGPNVPTNETFDVSRSDWSIRMTDGSQPSYSSQSLREPSLNRLTELTASECVRGWVTFDVPVLGVVAEVRFETTDWNSKQLVGRWVVKEVTEPLAF